MPPHELLVGLLMVARKSWLVIALFSFFTPVVYAIEIKVNHWTTNLNNVECFKDVENGQESFHVWIGRGERDTQERVEILIPGAKEILAEHEKGAESVSRKLIGGKTGTVDIVTYDPNRSPVHITYGLPRLAVRGECSVQMVFTEPKSDAMTLAISCTGVPRKLAPDSKEMQSYSIPSVECSKWRVREKK